MLGALRYLRLFTYRPDAPKSCGATVWVETLSSVDVIRCKLA